MANPADEPLGVATGLEPPSAAAMARAKPLFERLVTGEAKAVPPRFGGRCYDVALAWVAAVEAAAPHSPPGDEAPAAAMRRAASWFLWLERLSRITTSPGLSSGTSMCST